MAVNEYIKRKLDLGSITQDDAPIKRKETNKAYQLLEYKTWFDGKEDTLVDFYLGRTNPIDNYNIKTNYFWTNALTGKRRLTHSGLPRNISDTMAILLFHNGIEIVVNNEKEENKDQTIKLQNILLENSMNVLLNEGATSESWGGSFVYKCSFDPNISKNTIIEIAKPDSFEVVRERNRIKEIKFFEYSNIGNKQYKLVEIYGKGYIKYEVFLIKRNKEVQIEVKSIFVDLDDFTFSPKIILAGFKANKTIRGISDYHGLISEFDSLDEATSGLGNDLRKGLAHSYIPETRVKQDLKGNIYPPREFDTNFTIITSDFKEGSKNEITTTQADIRTESYKEANEFYTNMILSNVNLNRITLGLDSTIGANASAEARMQLESTSLRTRESRIKLWQPFLEKYFTIVLQANDIFYKKTTKEYKVNVEFNEYIQAPPIKMTVQDAGDLMEMKALEDKNELRKIVGLEESKIILTTITE
jgi:hypothetical protein